nr:leukocyte elastase inhibitor-like [Cherax quadricarinatus]
MARLPLSAVFLVALVSVASPQCISNNDKLSLPLTPDLEHIIPFSLDLLKEFNPPTTKGNFFFSPYSIWNALVLAYFGSAGQTRQQLQDVLRLSDPSNTLATYKALERLYEERQANTSEYVIDLANKIYVDDNLAIRDCIQEVLPKEVQKVDFRKANEAAATINNFVKETTRGKIPTLVSGGDVERAVMVLVNAAYFKGLWKSAFKPTDTLKKNFYPTPDKAILVDMMNQKDSFKIGDSNDLQARVLEMPYKGDAASMFVLLPFKNAKGITTSASTSATPLDTMLQRLNKDTFNAIVTNLRYEEVILNFPKFKLEHKITGELTETLQRLGIKDLFTSAANLSNYDPAGRLFVSKGIHKAVVEVTEEGTEAAAATALVAVQSSFVGQTKPPRLFTCDQPFLFVITDNVIKNILFMGIFRDPNNTSF